MFLSKGAQLEGGVGLAGLDCVDLSDGSIFWNLILLSCLYMMMAYWQSFQIWLHSKFILVKLLGSWPEQSL